MKKHIIVALMAVLLFTVPLQPAAASSDFSLANGLLDQTSEEYTLLREFFQSMPIATSYDEGKNKYALSGK